MAEAKPLKQPASEIAKQAQIFLDDTGPEQENINPADKHTTVLSKKEVPPESRTIEHYFDKNGVLLRGQIKQTIIDSLHQSIHLVKEVIREKFNKADQMSNSIINLFQIVKQECLDSVESLHNQKKGNIDQVHDLVENEQSELLEEFIIENCYNDKEMVRLLKAFKKSKIKKLVSFQLIYAQTYDSAMPQLTDMFNKKIFSNIEILTFMFCQMEDRHLSAILKSLVDNKCFSIKEFTCQYSTADTATAQGIAKCITSGTFVNLECLTIANCNVNEAMIKLIAASFQPGFCPKLKYLNFSENRLGEVGANDLFQAIERCEFQLQTLNLGGNALISNNITDQGVKFLTDCIKKGRLDQIVKLDLDTNSIGDSGIMNLLLGLQKLNNVKFLDIGSNDIHEEGGCEIGKMITQIPNLVKLELANNYLGGSISNLTDIFESESNLRYLGLSNNDIPEDAALQLIQKTQLTMKLDRKYIDLRYNQLNPDIVKSNNPLLFVVI